MDKLQFLIFITFTIYDFREYNQHELLSKVNMFLTENQVWKQAGLTINVGLYIWCVGLHGKPTINLTKLFVVSIALGLGLGLARILNIGAKLYPKPQPYILQTNFVHKIWL